MADAADRKDRGRSASAARSKRETRADFQGLLLRQPAADRDGPRSEKRSWLAASAGDVRIVRRWVWLFSALLPAIVVNAAPLPLPPRLADALTGSQLIERVAPLPIVERETRIETELLRGNVPEFLRRLYPVTLRDSREGRTNLIVIRVTPDYLAVGSDADYFLTPLTPATAQRIADATGCVLPTTRLVDAIHSAAPLKLQPAPIPPSLAMISVDVFAQHNAMVRTQRLAQATETFWLGTLVAGHKKDIVLTRRLTETPGKVAIYGWHKTNGGAIQPLYTGHADSWVDYSHGVRLVSATVEANGSPMSFAAALADSRFAPMLTDEGTGPLPRYGSPPSQRKAFAERTEELRPAPGVRVVINSPPTEAFIASMPIQLVLYALPNGNTIEQTAGRRPRSTNEWRFDIQHIAAQTRWLRAADTNHLWIVTYLEADKLSWPTWRRNHTNEAKVIYGIVESLTRRFTNHPIRLVLTGHSGGGSFTFGFLNALEALPENLERIAFLDSNYAYDPSRAHADKLARWLKASDRHFLTVLAYDDANALLDGKPFVSAAGGTWGRSHLMLTNLALHVGFTRADAGGFQNSFALERRVQFLLKENPERKVLHTIQVERNGFIHAMLAGTPLEGRGYEYFGPRAYEAWIEE